MTQPSSCQAPLAALVTYRAEKPFGVGRTDHERASRIVGGFRAEVTHGLADGEFCYTGVCETAQAAKDELLASLAERGHCGAVDWM